MLFLLAQLQVAPPRHSVGRLTREGLLRKVKTFLEPFATCLQATPGICSRSPNDWTGTLETQSASKTATSGKESCLTCHLRNSSAYAYHCSIHHGWFCRCQNGHQTLILSDECVHDGTHLGASKSNSQKTGFFHRSQLVKFLASRYNGSSVSIALRSCLEELTKSHRV